MHISIVKYCGALIVHHIREQVEELRDIGQLLDFEVECTFCRGFGIVIFILRLHGRANNVFQHYVEVFATIFLLQVQLFVLEIKDVTDKLLWNEGQRGVFGVHAQTVRFLVDLDMALHVIRIVYISQGVQMLGRIPGKR